MARDIDEESDDERAVELWNEIATPRAASALLVVTVAAAAWGGIGGALLTATSVSANVRSASANARPDQVVFTHLPPASVVLARKSIARIDAATNQPTVTSVSPSSGPTAGGTPVMISGTNFAAPASVSFGPAQASNVTVVNATTITATSPAGSGTVDVTVATSKGTSASSPADQFAFDQRPTVTGVSPIGGPLGGGNTVAISGTNFTPQSTVSFDGTGASSVTFVSAAELMALPSAHGVGTVNITVTTPGGTSATSSADQYAYEAPPVVARVSPSAGPTTGGTTVTIAGANFDGSTSVRFGAMPATHVTVIGARKITATTPLFDGAGTVDVTVVTRGA